MRDENMILSLGGLECVRNSRSSRQTTQHSSVAAAATRRVMILPMSLISSGAMRLTSAAVKFLES